MDHLPEGCVSKILSLTSPKDAARSSAVAKIFMSAAESDNVWEAFIPSDYLQAISRSGNLMEFPSKKQLYFSLCDTSILLDGGKLSLSVDKNTGGKCLMIAARKLGIIWGGTPAYWEWLSHPDARFSEVAKLRSISWLDIRGKIGTRMLSKRTSYCAYLVFKLEDRFYGLTNVKAVVRFADRESDHDVRERAKVVHFSGEVPGATLPLIRSDGWMELKMGNFFNDRGENGAVEARLMQTRQTWKHGLIVQGIEFRPE
ncbi:F-box protein PP2-B10-like [Solanum pennellii]|uniref:F-box protein PP2-B10-like n=1 Tax=Solanum pennellii TaxID=28526 RepID=A0ABM1GMA9_SOLPN|nr:F-box protein PP2-B10-like [Solanum pennellii]